MSRTVVAWGRIIGPAVVLAVVVWRLGTGPFVAGIRSIDGLALGTAAAIAVLTTVCCAWRWTIVARGLGIELPLPLAVAAYYRSLFLNVTLPGGIVGDVHRGISHGRDVSDIGRGLRAVAWERSAGQVVQILVTAVVLLAFPSPVQAAMPVVLAVLAGVVCLVLGVMVAGRSRLHGGLLVQAREAVARDVRDALLARTAWLPIALASALVVAGHAITFIIAARIAGTHAPLSRMLPIALLVMMAMVLPSVGGWGPREGVTAWAFGAAGLGAAQGVTTAVIYGVMVLVASMPGAAVLVVGWLRGTPLPAANQPPLRERPAHA